VSAALDQLVRTLDLERLEVDLFRGESPSSPLQRVFGGQVAAQALTAAVRTVDAGRRPHSLHGYFLVGGDPSVPIVYEVDRVRDGRSFSTRRVSAVQHGQTIFYLSTSFHIDEDGIDHQLAMPDVPSPEDVPTTAEWLTEIGEVPGIDPASVAWWGYDHPVELRYVGTPPVILAARAEVPPEPRSQVWMRARGRLPDDPALHMCVLTWASDMSLLDSVRLPHGWPRGTYGRGRTASLDHAVWFHRPFRADEWFLYDQESASAHGARGIAQGRIFTLDGRLVTSVVQEGLVRS